MELSTNETDGDIVIETGRGQDWSTGKEELFLDRNLKCFLCQRIIHGEGNAENERMGKVCLRTICHYLNVKKDKCDYSVEVCANCESVCNSLSGLVHQLEMTKMLIQDRLYQFNQILMKCGVKLEEKEDEELRCATRNKSSIKLKEMMSNSFPIVKLCRTSTTTGNVQETPLPLQTQWSEICTSPKQWVSNIFQKLVPNRHRYPCPFCKILVPEQIIRSHLLLGHSEKYFSKKLGSFCADVPEKTLKWMCQQHLLTEVKRARLRDHKSEVEQTISRNWDFECQYCNLKFNNEVRFKCHFLLTHFEILEEKVLHQDWISIQKKSRPISNTGKRKDVRESIINVKRTKTSNISLEFKSSLETTPASQEEKKIASQNKMSNDPFDESTTLKLEINKNSSILPQTSLASLKRLSAPKTKYNFKKRQPIYDICWTLSRRSNFDDKLQCTVCNRMYPAKKLTRLQRHQVNSHPERLFSQKNLQIRSDLHLPEQVFAEYCKKNLVQETKLSHLSNRSHQCKICLQKIHGGNDFRFHLMVDHHDILEIKLAIFINSERGEVIDGESDNITKSRDKVKEQDDNYDHVNNDSNLPHLPAEPEDEETDDRMLLTSEDNTSRSWRLSTSETPVSEIKSVDFEAKQIVYDICRTFSQRTESGSHYECTICNVLFPVSHLARLRRHIANSHPEKFFDREKLQPNMSEDLFLSCCRKVMGQVRKQSQLPYKPRTRLRNLVCKICKRKFFGGHDFKYHQILEHGERLEEMVREFLNGNGNEKIGGNEGLSNCKKRGRGRPPKKTVNDGGGKGLMVGLKKRGRGRPRKIRNELFEDLPNEDITESKPIIIYYETESLDQDQDNLRNDNLVKVDIVDEVEGREEFGIENNFDIMNYEDDDEPAIDEQHEIGTGTTDSEIDTKLVIKSVMSVPLQMDSILPDNFVNH